MIAVDLYHVEEKKLLPKDGRDIDGCKVGKAFGIRVKFKPQVISSDTLWKVWVLLDGKTLGYSHVMKPTDTKDGYYRTYFKGWRANDACTEMNELIFEIPADKGDGEFGSVHAFVCEGYYCGSKERQPRGYELQDKSGKTASESSTSDCGNLAAGVGKNFQERGFHSEKKWVSRGIVLDRRVCYGS